MNEIKGIEAQARPLPVLILADTSNSMSGSPISSLNQALSALVQDLKSDEQTRESVMLSLITFNSSVAEEAVLEPINTVQLPTLSASGTTSMGEAFRRALAHVGDETKVPPRCLMPVIVLASDGQPTDEWRTPLTELKNHRRAGNAIRLALAIGDRADRKVLEEFVSPEYPVLAADEPEKIKSFFQYVTFVSMKVFKSGGQDKGEDRVPSDLLP